MRKVLGVVCLTLGGFLLVAAALGHFWAPGQAKRTPLEVNTTTRLDGTAQKLDPRSGSVQDLRVKATSVTKSDTKHSDDDYIAFVTTTCLVIDRNDVPDCVTKTDPDRRLIAASTDTFATDRRTAMATNDPKYNAPDATDHEGLVNKFPFDVQKKTYQFWDGVLDQAVPATFQGFDTIDGLRTYRFHVAVPPTPAEVLAGTGGDPGVEGLYAIDKSIWVEPHTGAIVKQTQHEVRTLENGDPLLDLDIAYTEPTIKAATDRATNKANSLQLLTQVMPVTGLVAGLLLLLVGLALITSRRRTGRRRARR